MPSSVICCDASLVVRLITATGDSDVVRRWTEWKDSRVSFVAPPLMKYEVVNAFHRMFIAKEISATGCRLYLATALSLPIAFVDDVQIHFEALTLSAQLNLPAAYDAHYLAAALRHDAEFWTFDERLYRAASAEFSWVFLTG